MNVKLCCIIYFDKYQANIDGNAVAVGWVEVRSPIYSHCVTRGLPQMLDETERETSGYGASDGCDVPD